MGTHTYLFAKTPVLPTLRELMDWAAGKGHPLKLSVEMFDDDEEEDAFLAEHLDATTWRHVGFDDAAERWVGSINYIVTSDSIFYREFAVIQK